MGTPVETSVEREEGTKMKKKLHDEIAKVAYDLYEKEGRVHGNDLKDWFEAEYIVMGKQERHLHEIEKRVEPINRPPQGYRRTVKREGSYKKG